MEKAPFTILPAIDVSGGRLARAPGSARTSPGELDRVSLHDVLLDDVFEAARAWQTAGAEWLHLVDLDAAFGRGSNARLLADIVAAVTTGIGTGTDIGTETVPTPRNTMKVQWSGGVVDQASLDHALLAGADRIVLSTAALDDLDWCADVIAAHGARIAVALDVRVDREGVHHRLSARGSDGARSAPLELWDTLRRLDACGCERFVVTDVSRDGSLGGPNLDLYRQVAEATDTPLLASGGISTLDDLDALARMTTSRPTISDDTDTSAPATTRSTGTVAGLDGAIVGTALYRERFTLPDAIDAVNTARAPLPER